MKLNYHMKFAVNILFICSLMMGMGCSGDSSKEQQGQKLVALSNEDTLNLTKHEVDYAVAHAEFRDCRKYIQIGGRNPMDSVIVELEKTAIDDFKTIAMDNADQGCDSNFISCIKIIFGLDSSNTRMELLYKPMYACRTLVQGKDATYSVHEDHTYYRYDNSQGFVSTNDTACISRYKSQMQIDHHRNKHFEPVDSSDATAVIYPFQEIDTLFSLNNITTLTFMNIMVIDSVAGNPIVRHSIIIAPDANKKTTQPRYSAGGGSGKVYENLAHLCPPNCLELKFQLK